MRRTVTDHGLDIRDHHPDHPVTSGFVAMGQGLLVVALDVGSVWTVYQQLNTLRVAAGSGEPGLAAALDAALL